MHVAVHAALSASPSIGSPPVYAFTHSTRNERGWCPAEIICIRSSIHNRDRKVLYSLGIVQSGEFKQPPIDRQSETHKSSVRLRRDPGMPDNLQIQATQIRQFTKIGARIVSRRSTHMLLNRQPQDRAVSNAQNLKHNLQASLHVRLVLPRRHDRSDSSRPTDWPRAMTGPRQTSDGMRYQNQDALAQSSKFDVMATRKLVTCYRNEALRRATQVEYKRADGELYGRFSQLPIAYFCCISNYLSYTSSLTLIFFRSFSQDARSCIELGLFGPRICHPSPAERRAERSSK